MKSTGITYLLWLFFGVLGFHRFYLGKIGTGIIYFFTFALCGFGLIYDLFTIPRQVREVNLLRGGANLSANQHVIVNVNTGSDHQISEKKY